jgi:hypothetical protein
MTEQETQRRKPMKKLSLLQNGLGALAALQMAVGGVLMGGAAPAQAATCSGPVTMQITNLVLAESPGGAGTIDVAGPLTGPLEGPLGVRVFCQDSGLNAENVSVVVALADDTAPITGLPDITFSASAYVAGDPWPATVGAVTVVNCADYPSLVERVNATNGDVPPVWCFKIDPFTVDGTGFNYVKITATLASGAVVNLQDIGGHAEGVVQVFNTQLCPPAAPGNFPGVHCDPGDNAPTNLGTSGDIIVANTPELGSVALFGSGALGLAAYAMMRLRRH